MNELQWIRLGYDQGIIDEIYVDDPTTFDQVYRDWLKLKLTKIKAQTCTRYDDTYRKYIEGTDLSKIYVHSIDEQLLADFINACIKKYSISTAKEYDRLYGLLHSVLAWAFDSKQYKAAPDIRWNTVKICIEKKERASVPDDVTVDTRYMIPKEDRTKLFKYVLDFNVYPEKYMICRCILLNFYLGLRIGELAALRWCDVKLDDKVVIVHSTQTKFYEFDDDCKRIGTCNYTVQNTPKTKKSNRVIPLCDDAIWLLQQIRSWQLRWNIVPEFVCDDSSGCIISKNIERCIRRLCKLCDITYFSSHMIRKTFASELHMSGVPTKIISDLLGHTEIRTTEKCYLLSYKDAVDMCRPIIQSTFNYIDKKNILDI